MIKINEKKLDDYTLSVIYDECYLSTREISNITGIPKSTVYDRISKNIKLRTLKNASKVKRDDIKISTETIMYFVAMGWKTKDMSILFGVSPRTVRRWTSNIKKSINDFYSEIPVKVPNYKFTEEELKIFKG